MSFKINIGTDPRVFYALNGGDDNENGTSLETAKSTIQATVDAVNALVPPVNVLNRASIFITGSSIFLENIIFPEFTNYDARDITNTVSSGNTYTLNNSSSYNVGLSVVSTIAGVIFVINGTANISLICSAANVVGIDGSAVLILSAGDDIFINIDKLRLTGLRSIGLNHNATNGEPEFFVLGSATLEANDTICVMHNGITGARSVMDIGTISDVGGPTGTTGIRVINGHLSVFCGEIIAATAITVEGGTLAYIGNCITGNINVDVGATLNCEIAEFTGTITNNGTIVGRIGTQSFGGGFVTATGTLTADTVIRGNGGTDVESSPHLTSPNNQLNLQILANNDTGLIAIRDEAGVEKVSLSYEDVSGLSLLRFPDGLNLKHPGGDAQIFMSLDSTPAASGAVSPIFVGINNPEGNAFAFSGFCFRGAGANTSFYIQKSGIPAITGWFPAVTGPNTGTVNNRIVLWDGTNGERIKDTSIITYQDGANNFLEFNNASAATITGISWFRFGGTPGPSFIFTESVSQITTQNFGGTTTINSMFINSNVSSIGGFATFSNLSNPDTAMIRFNRTGVNPADLRFYISSQNPTTGVDGDFAIRQDTGPLTDIFLNIDGTYTGIFAAIAASGGSETLAQTLVLGNFTGGTNIAISGGDAIEADTLTIRSGVASTIPMMVWDRTGSNAADTQVFIASTAPSGGGDGDIAIRQATTNTDLFINVNGVWTGVLAAGGTPTLAATLAVGNTTGGTNLAISNGDEIGAAGGETTGTVINLNNLNSLSTGTALDITSASSDAAARDLVRFINDDPGAAFVTVLRIRDDSLADTSSAIDCTGQTFFDTNPLDLNEIGFSIDCDSTTGAGTVFDVNANTSIANGTIVASIAQNHFAATTTTALSVANLSTGANSLAISVAGNTVFTSIATTGNANFFDLANITDGVGVRITGDQLTTGASLFIDSNAPSALERDMVNIQNLNASAVLARCLSMSQFSTAAIYQLITATANLEVFARSTTAQGSFTANPGDVHYVDNSLGTANLEVNFGTSPNNNRWGTCVGGPATLLFGASSVATTTTLRFLYPGYSSIVAQTADIASRMTRTGFLRNMFVGQNVGAGNGNDIVYTVHLNDVATALSVEISSLVVVGSDTTNIVEVVAGDEISVRVTKVAGIGSSPQDIVVSIDYI